ncbi:MAG: RNA 2',3'-cyclic phosphodiesterase [Candidatus Omnitrophota bacterium]
MNEKAQKIRTFIALELSDEAREEFARITGILEESNADVKWVKPGSIHLTLKFLGYVEEDKVVRISEKLKDIVLGVAPFNVVLEGIGVFPKWDYVKVIWVGLGEGADKVKELSLKAEEAMQAEGFEKEKREYSPHLTLGRIRSAKNKNELKKQAETVKVEPVSNHISKIILFKSELSSQGAVYTALATAELEG